MKESSLVTELQRIAADMRQGAFASVDVSSADARELLGRLTHETPALHQQTDAALWLLRYLNRLGGLGQDKHRLIDAVLEGRAKVLGDTLHIEQPSEKASE